MGTVHQDGTKVPDSRGRSRSKSNCIDKIDNCGAVTYRTSTYQTIQIPTEQTDKAHARGNQGTKEEEKKNDLQTGARPLNSPAPYQLSPTILTGPMTG